MPSWADERWYFQKREQADARARRKNVTVVCTPCYSFWVTWLWKQLLRRVTCIVFWHKNEITRNREISLVPAPQLEP